MSHVAHMNASHLTSELKTARASMNYVAHMIESCCTYE